MYYFSLVNRFNQVDKIKNRFIKASQVEAVPDWIKMNSGVERSNLRKSKLQEESRLQP